MPDFASHNAAFAEGVEHPVNQLPHVNGGSLTLNSQSQGWDDAVGRAMQTAHSTLDPLAYSDSQSANGTSGKNFLPGLGVIGTQNGLSDETFDQNQTLRYQGGDDAAELD
jgi:hypothetical protein